MSVEGTGDNSRTRGRARTNADKICTRANRSGYRDVEKYGIVRSSRHGKDAVRLSFLSLSREKKGERTVSTSQRLTTISSPREFFLLASSRHVASRRVTSRRVASRHTDPDIHFSRGSPRTRPSNKSRTLPFFPLSPPRCVIASPCSRRLITRARAENHPGNYRGVVLVHAE